MMYQNGTSHVPKSYYKKVEKTYVPKLISYVPKDSQPFRSRANLLSGANWPIEPWPIRSLELSLPGPFALWPIRSLALSLHGTYARSLELTHGAKLPEKETVRERKGQGT